MDKGSAAEEGELPTSPVMPSLLASSSSLSTSSASAGVTSSLSTSQQSESGSRNSNSSFYSSQSRDRDYRDREGTSRDRDRDYYNRDRDRDNRDMRDNSRSSSDYYRDRGYSGSSSNGGHRSISGDRDRFYPSYNSINSGSGSQRVPPPPPPLNHAPNPPSNLNNSGELHQNVNKSANRDLSRDNIYNISNRGNASGSGYDRDQGRGYDNRDNRGYDRDSRGYDNRNGRDNRDRSWDRPRERSGDRSDGGRIFQGSSNINSSSSSYYNSSGPYNTSKPTYEGPPQSPASRSNSGFGSSSSSSHSLRVSTEINKDYSNYNSRSTSTPKVEVNTISSDDSYDKPLSSTSSQSKSGFDSSTADTSSNKDSYASSYQAVLSSVSNSESLDELMKSESDGGDLVTVTPTGGDTDNSVKKMRTGWGVGLARRVNSGTDFGSSSSVDQPITPLSRDNSNSNIVKIGSNDVSGASSKISDNDAQRESSVADSLSTSLSSINNNNNSNNTLSETSNKSNKKVGVKEEPEQIKINQAKSKPSLTLKDVKSPKSSIEIAKSPSNQKQVVDNKSKKRGNVSESSDDEDEKPVTKHLSSDSEQSSESDDHNESSNSDSDSDSESKSDISKDGAMIESDSDDDDDDYNKVNLGVGEGVAVKEISMEDGEAMDDDRAEFTDRKSTSPKSPPKSPKSSKSKTFNEGIANDEAAENDMVLESSKDDDVATKDEYRPKSGKGSRGGTGPKPKTKLGDVGESSIPDGSAGMNSSGIAAMPMATGGDSKAPLKRQRGRIGNGKDGVDVDGDGATKGRGRLPKSKAEDLKNKAGGAHVMKKKDTLDTIFSREQDYSRAFQVIKQMINLQPTAAILNFPQMEINLQPLPTINDINSVFDFIEMFSDHLSNNLLDVRRRQVMFEKLLLKVAEINYNSSLEAVRNEKNLSQEPSSPSREDFMISIQTDITEVPTSTSDNDHIAPTSDSVNKQEELSIQSIKKNLATQYIPLIKQIMDRNKEVAFDAHFIESLQCNDDLYGYTSNPLYENSTESSTKQSGGTNTVPSNHFNEDSEGRVFSITPVIDHIRSTLFSMPKPADIKSHVANTATEIKENRPFMVAEIRKRKLSRRKVWETLADNYLGVQQKWNKHMECLEIENNEYHPKSTQRENVNTLDAHRSSGTGGAASRRNAGNSTDSKAESDLLANFGVRSSSRIMGISAGNNMFQLGLSKDGQDPDKLMRDLMILENPDMKFVYSAAKIPAMMSPWCLPDPFKEQPAPVWPDSVRKISRKGEAVAPESSYKQYQPFVEIFDTYNLNGNRLTLDGRRQMCLARPLESQCPDYCNCPRQIDKLNRVTRVWTDTEKAIFVDKFLQYPKNFTKIASFLVNRTTKDCIKFYYDSKYLIPYKALLKEVENRKKNTKTSWTYAVQAASAVGCGLYPPKISTDKDPMMQLPSDDNSFSTFLYHPPFQADVFGFSPRPVTSSKNNQLSVNPPYPRKSTIEMAEHRLSLIQKEKAKELKEFEEPVSTPNQAHVTSSGRSIAASSKNKEKNDQFEQEKFDLRQILSFEKALDPVDRVAYYSNGGAFTKSLTAISTYIANSDNLMPPLMSPNRTNKPPAMQNGNGNNGNSSDANLQKQLDGLLSPSKSNTQLNNKSITASSNIKKKTPNTDKSENKQVNADSLNAKSKTKVAVVGGVTRSRGRPNAATVAAAAALLAASANLANSREAINASPVSDKIVGADNTELANQQVDCDNSEANLNSESLAVPENEDCMDTGVSNEQETGITQGGIDENEVDTNTNVDSDLVGKMDSDAHVSGAPEDDDNHLEGTETFSDDESDDMNLDQGTDKNYSNITELATDESNVVNQSVDRSEDHIEMDESDSESSDGENDEGSTSSSSNRSIGSSNGSVLASNSDNSNASASDLSENDNDNIEDENDDNNA